jgi:hypothetical protein
MLSKISDLFLWLYVWIDVTLFMTAERISAALPERKSA